VLWRRVRRRSGRGARRRPGASHAFGGGHRLFGVATHKLSRLLAKDKVTAPLRAPFAEFEDEGGPAEVDDGGEVSVSTTG
jgi:Protein of unknown function (DUF1360)